MQLTGLPRKFIAGPICQLDLDCKVELKQLFNSLDADIICLQETKVTRDMLDEPTAIVEGYNSYFSFSRKKSGYSGVATFCKDACTPEKAAEGLTGGGGDIGCPGDQSSFTTEELESLDAEGRALITQHRIRLSDGVVKEMAVINVYCPRADPDREDRLAYKLHFFALLQTRAEALIKQGRYVVLLGDVNVSHRKIDKSEPDDEDFYSRPGRVWLNQMLWEGGRDRDIDSVEDREMFPATTPYVEGGMFVDAFRHRNPETRGAFTCWCTMTSARQTNYGNRIDYILMNKSFVEVSLVDSVVMQEIEGSDHCPVKVEINANNINPAKPPPLCTQFMPEFSGKQQKLSNFFIKMKRDESVQDEPPPLKSSKSDSSQNHPVIQRRETLQVVSTSKLKRTSSELNESVNAKRAKVTPQNSGGGKQSSLANFFCKRNQKKNTETNNTIEEAKSESKSENIILNNVMSSGDMDTNVTPASETSSIPSQPRSSGTNSTSSQPKSSVNAWKNLLGGLPPPPLCKGHKEPCVLRTVKKDGPNRGKQFYTCARAEGHSSNPEARCDFFKWIEKKKNS
ncbi:hypothetical protein ScPMuIL_008502 [Solemya velum]